MSILTLLRHYFDSPIHLKIYYYSGWLHYLWLSSFILFISKPAFDKVQVAFWVYGWFLVLCLILFLNTYEDWMIFSVSSDVGLLIFSGFYYYKLFSDTSPINIFVDSSFWAVTGIFVCKCFSLPMVAFYSFFQTNMALDATTVKNVFSIGAIGYIIMHLFFIKAFLCSVRRLTI